MQLLTSKRAKSKSPARPDPAEVEIPILSEEDEAFLQRIAEEDEKMPPELPERPGPPLPPRPRPQDLREAGDTGGNDLQLALVDESEGIPQVGGVGSERGQGITTEPSELEGTAEGDKAAGKKRSKWSWLRRDSRDANRKTTATDLMSAAEGLKSPDAQPNEDGQVSDPEAQKEEEEMTQVLDDLNLAAVNNRVFSISKESQELLRK